MKFSFGKVEPVVVAGEEIVYKNKNCKDKDNDKNQVARIDEWFSFKALFENRKIEDDVSLDMIISAVSAEEDREEFVDFSVPYYIMRHMLIVLSDAELKTREDLNEKKVGILDNEIKDLLPEYLVYFLNYLLI